MAKDYCEKTLVAVVFLFLLTAVGAAYGGEKLYNGIVLSDEWPPKIDKLTSEPRPVPYLDSPPAVIGIDVGRQLFVDDFLIEQTNLQRVFHTAQVYSGNPVLKADREWEIFDGVSHAIVFSDGVWYDPADKLFKMWYMTAHNKATGYAVSRDGIAWEKPELDIYPGTNLIFKVEYNDSTYRDSCIVWLDHNEKDPQKRFKITLSQSKYDDRMTFRYSADGIHWGQVAKISGDAGDRSTFFYNPFRRVWVYSIRSNIKTAKTRRSRMRRYYEDPQFASSVDWKDEDPVLWMRADKLEPFRPGVDVERQLYNLDGMAYESLMVGFFAIWQGPGNSACKRQGIAKRNEILLGFSRDGFHWHRPDRRAFIGVNYVPGAWNRGNVQSAGGGFLVVGDRLYFYFSGRAKYHVNQGATASTGLAFLRRDGFASMDAGNSKGVLTTRPVRFSGKYLFVNADVYRGQLRVEVLDKDGKVVTPFTRENCIAVQKDSTIAQVKWKDGGGLSKLAGEVVKFRFFVKRGQLYSFWVSPDKSGASYGYVGAGGPGFSEPRDTVGSAAYK